jgi:hypothetical protein
MIISLTKLIYVSLGHFARNDIIFFRGRHYDLHLRKLLFCHLSVVSEFADFDIENFEMFGEVANHQRFHGSNIYDFEIIEIKFAGFFVTVLGEFVENRQPSYVCLQTKR